MLVSDILTSIENNADYITNSLILKNSDDKGCTYKWLSRTNICAMRKQIFIATSGEGDLPGRTAIEYIEVFPAV